MLKYKEISISDSTVKHTGAHTHTHRAFFCSHYYKQETTSPPMIYRVLYNLNTNLSYFSEHTFYCSFPLLLLSGQLLDSSSGSLYLLVPPRDMLFRPRSAERVSSNPSRPDSVTFSEMPSLATLFKTAASGNSLAIQWLGVHTSTSGDTSLILGQGSKIS